MVVAIICIAIVLGVFMFFQLVIDRGLAHDINFLADMINKILDEKNEKLK